MTSSLAGEHLSHNNLKRKSERKSLTLLASKAAGEVWDVALQIATLREQAGLTQKELAKLLKTSQHLLAQSDPLHPKLLIRAEQDRRLQDPTAKLWPFMESQAVAGARTLGLPRRQGRAARTCVLEIRFAPVQLNAPKSKPSLGALRLWAVYVKEIDPPSAKQAIEWMLLTTLEVHTFEQALEKIDWYNKRWGIEEYHKTLKSVCRIEDRQLGDRTVWQNCLAIDLVVAWRIEHIKKLARTQPQTPLMGTITLSGKTPTASSLTITAGRDFLISAPIVGSRLMSQISPLCTIVLAVKS